MRRVHFAALLALLPLLSSCANLKQFAEAVPRPSASVEGTRIEDFRLRSLTLALDLRLDNPTSVDVPMVDMDLRLLSGGAQFLEGTFPLQGVIPGRGSRRVTVPVELDLVETVRTLSGVRPGQLVDYRAEMDLTVDLPVTGPIVLPLAHEGSLPVPAPPSVDLEGFAWSELGLQRVAGTVTLRVANPNAFAVGLDALDLGLALAGREVADLQVDAGPQLEAGGQSALELPLSLSPLELGTAVFDVLRGNDAAYGLTGNLAVGTPFGELSVPVTTSGTAPISRTR